MERKIPKMKIKMRKCEDGVKRPFVRRKVELVDAWNAVHKEYKEASMKYAKSMVNGEKETMGFYEGYIAGLVATIHILKHLKDKITVELPADPPAYADIKEIDKIVQKYADDLLDGVEEAPELEKSNGDGTYQMKIKGEEKTVRPANAETKEAFDEALKDEKETK